LRFDVGEPLIAAPLQQLAHGLLSSATLLSSPPRLVVSGSVVIAHRHPPIRSKRWMSRFSG
jgi:hypothetical protein